MARDLGCLRRLRLGCEMSEDNSWGDSQLTKYEIAEKHKTLNDQLRHFTDAVVKGEGQSVNAIYGIAEDYTPTKPIVETTYVERRVPVFLEDAAHKLTDQFLCDHGYDPEEI